MNHTQIELQFREALEDTDYGLIIGSEGELKGIWIPNGMQDKPMPQGIISMCQRNFGIDPSQPHHYSAMQ